MARRFWADMAAWEKKKKNLNVARRTGHAARAGFEPVEQWQIGNQTTCGVAKGELEAEGAVEASKMTE